MTRLARLGRFLKSTAPVLLDVAGFILVTIGVYLAFGASLALIIGGVLLVLAGYRAQT